jgi:chaperone modulatory protein CbpM
MSTTQPSERPAPRAVVEEELQLTLVELSRACRAPEQQIHVWVGEGVLEPVGTAAERLAPTEWRFAGATLRRARLAWRLTRDLEVNAAGVAVALDLIEQIEALRAERAHGYGANVR